MEEQAVYSYEGKKSPEFLEIYAIVLGGLLKSQTPINDAEVERTVRIAIQCTKELLKQLHA